MSERTDRLNELARKEKSEGLTAEEKAEQKRLRDEFRAIFRKNFAMELEKPAPSFRKKNRKNNQNNLS